MKDISLSNKFENDQNYLQDVLARVVPDTLVSLVSYELDTTLASLRAALTILLSGKFGTIPQPGQRLLEIAINNTERLVRLTGTLEKEEQPLLNSLAIDTMTRIELEKDLKEALQRQEFQVYYQPIVSLETNEFTGFEALVRWQHPDRGLISPVEFIPLAEKTGLIDRLGIWVMREACHQLFSWQQQFDFNPPLTMSVNLSSIQLSNPYLVKEIQEILQETGISSSCLSLEITESTTMENPEMAIATLRQLKALGILLYMDDFGTGYSSLSRLHDLPIDVLKIDRSFVSQKRWDIIWTMLILASTLELEVIVEGIETEEELTQLKTLGCKYGQGYLYSKPLNSQSATELIAAHLK